MRKLYSVWQTHCIISRLIDELYVFRFRYRMGAKYCDHCVCLFVCLFGQLLVLDMSLKPRPHQQQCRSNIVECYKSNDSFDKVECCFDIVAGFGNNVERNFVLHASQTEHCLYDKLVRHCCRFWKQVECCFDKIERCFDTVAGKVAFSLTRSNSVDRVRTRANTGTVSKI